MNAQGHNVFGRVAGWDDDKLRRSRWVVVGAGALGNEVLKNLALLGVGEILVMDFDQVEATNLSRSVMFRATDIGEWKAKVAARFLSEISPDTVIKWMVGDVLCDLGAGILEQADVIIGCVDNRLARMMLNRHCFRVGKPWINAGIEQLQGEVAVFAPEVACYECRLTPVGRQEIRTRLSCPDIALRYASQGTAVTTPLAAATAAAIQVNEGLKLLFEQEGGHLQGKRLFFDLGEMSFREAQLAPPQPNCDSHFGRLECQTLDGLSALQSLGDALEVLRAHLGAEPVIHLDFEVVTAAGQLKEGEAIPLVAPRMHLPARLAELYPADERGGWAIPPENLVHRLDAQFPSQSHSLLQLGVPYGHIIKVSAGEERFHFRLGGDLGTKIIQKGPIQVPSPALALS